MNDANDIIERHFRGGEDSYTKGMAVRKLVEIGFVEVDASDLIDREWKRRFAPEPTTLTIQLAPWQYIELIFALESAELHPKLTDSEKSTVWSLLEHIQDEVAEDMQ